MNEELVVKLASDSFVSQFRGPSNLHEDATNDNANCGPACLAMLAKIFGCRELDALNANDLIEEMRTLATGDLSEYSCTTMPELNSALIHLGLETKWYDQTATVSEVARQLQKGRKILLRVDDRHVVVAVGMQQGKVVISDPSKQTPSLVSLAELDRSMLCGHMIVVSPPFGFWQSACIVLGMAIGFAALTRVLIGLCM